MDLINDPEVTAVYIATPVESHKRIAIEVLKAGKPCFLEKPMARNSSDSEEITSMFHKYKIPLYVAYYRRAHPRYIRVRSILQKNLLGPITSIRYTFQNDKHTNPNTEFDWRIEPEMSGGGYFVDVGCHLFDILDFLFGRLENVQGDAFQTQTEVYPEELKVETNVSATFRTIQGALGIVSFNFAGPVGQHIDELIITGVRGRIIMSGMGSDSPVIERPYTCTDGSIVWLNQQIECPYPEHTHLPLVQCIVNDLRDINGASVISSGESACRTAKVVDTILRKFYGNRNDEFWLRT